MPPREKGRTTELRLKSIPCPQRPPVWNCDNIDFSCFSWLHAQECVRFITGMRNATKIVGEALWLEAPSPCLQSEMKRGLKLRSAVSGQPSGGDGSVSSPYVRLGSLVALALFRDAMFSSRRPAFRSLWARNALPSRPVLSIGPDPRGLRSLTCNPG